MAYTKEVGGRQEDQDRHDSYQRRYDWVFLHLPPNLLNAAYGPGSDGLVAEESIELVSERLSRLKPPCRVF